MACKKCGKMKCACGGMVKKAAGGMVSRPNAQGMRDQVKAKVDAMKTRMGERLSRIPGGTVGKYATDMQEWAKSRPQRPEGAAGRGFGQSEAMQTWRNARPERPMPGNRPGLKKGGMVKKGK